jgi:hypothetical protein
MLAVGGPPYMADAISNIIKVLSITPGSVWGLSLIPMWVNASISRLGSYAGGSRNNGETLTTPFEHEGDLPHVSSSVSGGGC